MTVDLLTVKQEIRRILPEIVSLRRHLHAHPELSLEEHGTAAFIREKLSAAGIAALAPYLQTDVVAVIAGQGDGRNVTLRADIDALPVCEAPGHPHRSLREGVMHACGHDGHTAMLVGAALVLNGLRDRFCGSVRCVFQPGEENVAAGKDLVVAGVLRDPEPDGILALHAWPGYPAGTIVARPGPMMAAADIFSLTIKGEGGHGSRPECAVDPILTATRVIDCLYQIPRRIGALDPVVITVCAIQGGSNANAIPDEVFLQGSARYTSHEAGARLPELVEGAIRIECERAGATYDLNYRRPYPPTINDERIVAVCKEMWLSQGGPEGWLDLPRPSMGAEDFAYYLVAHPGAMFFLGNGEDSAQLHSNCFDFNDDALEAGVLFFVLGALTLLQ